MSRKEKNLAKKKEEQIKLAKRILSIGIAIVIVGGVSVLVIGNNKEITPIPNEEIVYDYVPKFGTIPNNEIKAPYPEDVIYEILPNDNLVKICIKHNLNPNHYLMLAYYNHIDNPNLIFVGDTINVPVEEKLIEKAIYGINSGVPLLRDKYHLVKEGDRLYNVCQNRYGSGDLAYAIAYWQQIDPDDIQVNQIIYLLSKDELSDFIIKNHEEIEAYKQQFVQKTGRIL